MFNKDGPSNSERHAKCNDMKEKWIKCIDTITQLESVRLKEEFEGDDEAIRGLPLEKLVSYKQGWLKGIFLNPLESKIRENPTL